MFSPVRARGGWVPVKAHQMGSREGTPSGEKRGSRKSSPIGPWYPVSTHLRPCRGSPYRQKYTGEAHLGSCCDPP